VFDYSHNLQEPVSQQVLDVACMLDMYLFSVGFRRRLQLYSPRLGGSILYMRTRGSMRDDPSERRLAAVCHLDSMEPGYSNKSPDN
jgi:hypothetical protein